MDALPPELYEVINGAISSTCGVALFICVRYLVFEYANCGHLMRFKLAIGFTVFLTGETTRMTWVWLVRYLANRGYDTAWMGVIPWVFIPIAGSMIAILGMACIVKSLTPYAWGRWGYVGAIGAAAFTVLLTRVI